MQEEYNALTEHIQEVIDVIKEDNPECFNE